MKVIVNGKFLSQRVTGVQRYAREILNELDAICNDIEIEIAIPSDAEIPQYKNIKVKQIGKLRGTWWELISFSRYVKKQKAISLNLCNSAPLSGRKIVTIHDVKIKAHPEFFSKKFLLWYNFLFKNITKRANFILTVSEFSKREIIKYYKVSENKIRVIHNAWQHFNKVGYDEKSLNKYGLEKEKYFFSMSSLEPNKNLKWIIHAAQNNSDFTFAVAGISNSKVFAEKKSVLPDNVKLLGYVSDEEAKTLMRDCKAFIYPTIYEGFGIPPLEAISAGSPQIMVSDTEIMHEIFSEYANYIDPLDYNFHYTDECSKESGLPLLDKYSWKKSAGNLLEILSQI